MFSYDKKEEKASDNLQKEVTEKSVPHISPVTKPVTPPITSMPQPKGDCVISAGTKITGNVETKDNVNLMGELIGDMTSTSNVVLIGTMKGNLVAKSVEFRGGKLEGNLNCTDNVNFSSGSAIVGNINANRLNLQKNSSVTGDIKAQVVVMEEGASVHGSLSVGGPKE